LRQEQPKTNTAQQQIVQVLDGFGSGCPAQFGPKIELLQQV
jgi:hypothetical protein